MKNLFRKALLLFFAFGTVTLFLQSCQSKAVEQIEDEENEEINFGPSPDDG